jgi:alpha,alpha-trehalose phosphorylase
VFWDVEIFKLPFYLHTVSGGGAQLLLYRYHTSTAPGGAPASWATGARATPGSPRSPATTSRPRTIRLKTTGKEIPIFTGTQQIHVTAGVAYGVWRYWDATRDAGFLRDAGVEILLETARFWASRCVRGLGTTTFAGRRPGRVPPLGERQRVHELDGALQPGAGGRAVEWMEREAPGAWERRSGRALALAGDEPSEWRRSRASCTARPERARASSSSSRASSTWRTTLPREERFKAPISRLFDWERINRLQLIKQADVLMLLHLFPDAFSREVLAANYRYYEPITDHGSSLSPGSRRARGRADRPAARTRSGTGARACGSTSRTVMGNSALGVHPACMGATWQALVFGFLGVRFTDAGPVPDADAAARLPAKVARRVARARLARPRPAWWIGRTNHEPVSVHPGAARRLAMAARALGCAVWLAARLGARLHILSATPQERPAREELTRLKVPGAHWPLITLHQARRTRRRPSWRRAFKRPMSSSVQPAAP